MKAKSLAHRKSHLPLSFADLIRESSVLLQTWIAGSRPAMTERKGFQSVTPRQMAGVFPFRRSCLTAEIKPDSSGLDPVIQIGAWGRWFLDRRIMSGDDKGAVSLAKHLI